jgi:hypothetical protein
MLLDKIGESMDEVQHLIFFMGGFQMSTEEKKFSVMSFEEREMEKILEYWTSERMEKAEPISVPELSQEEFEKYVSVQEEDQGENDIYTIHQDARNEMLGTPFPADVDKRPYWCGGVIFFSDKNGRNYKGTAEFVGNSRMIMTAAHCVRNGRTGDWYQNFLFVRGYNRGRGQRIALITVGTQDAWVGSHYEYDYAFGYTQADTETGWLGLQTGMLHEEFQAIGYPENFGEGQVMYAVDGKRGEIKSGIVQMVGNPMGRGCSGGAWIANLSSEGGASRNLSVGLNSFRYANEPNNMYGPLFTRDTIALYNYVLTCGTRGCPVEEIANVQA